MRTEVAFTEVAHATEVALTWTPVDPTEDQRASFLQLFPSMTGGWSGTFDQLDDFLAR